MQQISRNANSTNAAVCCLSCVFCFTEFNIDHEKEHFHISVDKEAITVVKSSNKYTSHVTFLSRSVVLRAGLALLESKQLEDLQPAAPTRFNYRQEFLLLVSFRSLLCVDDDWKTECRQIMWSSQSAHSCCPGDSCSISGWANGMSDSGARMNLSQHKNIFF